MELSKKPGVCVKSRSAFYIKETSRDGWFLCTFADVANFPKVVGRDKKTPKNGQKWEIESVLTTKKPRNGVGAHLRCALEFRGAKLHPDMARRQDIVRNGQGAHFHAAKRLQGKKPPHNLSFDPWHLDRIQKNCPIGQFFKAIANAIATRAWANLRFGSS